MRHKRHHAVIGGDIEVTRLGGAGTLGGVPGLGMLEGLVFGLKELRGGRRAERSLLGRPG